MDNRDAKRKRPITCLESGVTYDSAYRDVYKRQASPGSLEKLSETEKVAMQIAHDSGCVARKELMEQTGIGRVKATETLKRLAEKGLLEWVGSNQHDPRQYYRASGR